MPHAYSRGYCVQQLIRMVNGVEQLTVLIVTLLPMSAAPVVLSATSTCMLFRGLSCLLDW